jgi:hypothetical protein
MASQALWVDYCANREGAQRAVLAKLGAGHLFASGEPQLPGSEPVRIPSSAWFRLRLDTERHDVVHGDGGISRLQSSRLPDLDGERGL